MEYSTYPFINPDLDFVYNPQHNPQKVVTLGDDLENIPEQDIDCGCGCKGSGECQDELEVIGSPYNSGQDSQAGLLDYLMLIAFLVIIIMLLKSFIGNGAT